MGGCGAEWHLEPGKAAQCLEFACTARCGTGGKGRGRRLGKASARARTRPGD